MSQLIFLLLLILIVLAIRLPLIISKFYKNFEGYSNYSLDQAIGAVPDSQTQVLVQDTYAPIGLNQLSNNGANDIWMEYPIFQLGSYDQITNNIRYPNNPDNGTCMPASMCNALYYDKKHVESYYPQSEQVGTRIGCFTTENRLIDSLPFTTDNGNILY